MASENYQQFIERLTKDPTKLAFRELEKPAVVEFLLTALQAEQADLRLDAALFFERAGEFLARHPDNAAVRQALAQATEFLVARLQDDNRDVREVAAATFQHVRDARVFPILLAVLQKRLIEPDNSEAVTALAVNGGTQALEYLETLAKSKEYELRTVAAGGLGAISDSAAVALLEDLLDDDQDIVRATAAQQLGNFGNNPQALQILINRFRYEEVSLVRFRILDSFASYPNTPETIPYLVEGLTDDPELLDAAINSLKQQNFELVLQSLLPLLSQDEDEEPEVVQGKVILALRELGNPAAIPVLETIVATNSDPLNVVDAQEAIRILQQPKK